MPGPRLAKECELLNFTPITFLVKNFNWQGAMNLLTT